MKKKGIDKKQTTVSTHSKAQAQCHLLLSKHLLSGHQVQLLGDFCSLDDSQLNSPFLPFFHSLPSDFPSCRFKTHKFFFLKENKDPRLLKHQDTTKMLKDTSYLRCVSF